MDVLVTSQADDQRLALPTDHPPHPLGFRLPPGLVNVCEPSDVMDLAWSQGSAEFTLSGLGPFDQLDSWVEGDEQRRVVVLDYLHADEVDPAEVRDAIGFPLARLAYQDHLPRAQWRRHLATEGV